MEKLFKCGSHILDMSRKTYIMGILNVTPDSFSDAGEHFGLSSALEYTEKMLSDGADIIDIGAQSTRPGCTKIGAKEEWGRLKDVLPAIISKFPNAIISLDTFYPEIAERAAQLGINIINDISGGSEDMLKVAKEYGLGIVIMHPGNPDNINGVCGDIVIEVERFFIDKRSQAISLGLDECNLCFDPGIGFGKSFEQNIRLINATKRLSNYSNAYLMGLSRKRVTDTGGLSFEKRLGSTISLNTLAQMYGANILRVHDVFDAVTAAKATDSTKLYF